MLAVGLMTGTSLDGIDAALVRIAPKKESYSLELVRFATVPYQPELRGELLANLPPNTGSIKAAALLHRALGDAYGRAVKGIAGTESVDFVASHGQTLWHDGARHVTLQLGDAFLIREAAGATVCYDFRSADCAAGGHGAPLVAYVDALLLGDETEDRAALNLGGIANVTLMRKATSPQAAIAFDTGPGNMLIDAFVAQRSAGRLRFDDDGKLARNGRIDERLLAAMLADDFFSADPPKTTGRERFGARFLSRHAPAVEALSLEDGAATLVELTAVSVTQAIARAGFRDARVIVSGGGARNPTLIGRLAARLKPARVEISDAMDLPAEAKEAMAFTVLGYETLRERAANVPASTGATRRVVLGGIAPYDLRALLAKVEDECKTFS